MTQKTKQQPEDEWFDAVVKQYQSRLIAYGARILNDTERAKDATQEAFMKLYRAENRDTVKDHVAPWLYRVVRNQALNIKRKEMRMIQQETPEAIPSNEASRQQKEAAESLLDMIHLLTPPKGELVMLKFKDGFSYKEIASITGLSVSHVGYQLHHAIRELKTQWEAQGQTANANS